MIIAVDFDGTIVEHKYPEIGRIPFAIETLKKLQQERHRLILWSVREGKLLRRPWISATWTGVLCRKQQLCGRNPGK